MDADVTEWERFEPKVMFEPMSGCWLWIAALSPYGYAAFSVGGRAGRMVPGHRWSYEHFVGPIPEGLTLDHLCRVRGCVNPWHLEPVTRGENVMRGFGPAAIAARATHCQRGHLKSESMVSNGPRKRTCGPCRELRKAAA